MGREYEIFRETLRGCYSAPTQNRGRLIYANKVPNGIPTTGTGRNAAVVCYVGTCIPTHTKHRSQNICTELLHALGICCVKGSWTKLDHQVNWDRYKNYSLIKFACCCGRCRGIPHPVGKNKHFGSKCFALFAPGTTSIKV